jgi:hypothetical protein
MHKEFNLFLLPYIEYINAKMNSILLGSFLFKLYRIHKHKSKLNYAIISALYIVYNT